MDSDAGPVSKISAQLELFLLLAPDGFTFLSAQGEMGEITTRG